MSGKMTDERVLDEIAGYMGAQEDWNGADICEMVADLVGATGRPHPGNKSGTEYVERFDKYLDGCSGNKSARYFDMTTAAQDAGWEPEEEFEDGQ